MAETWQIGGHFNFQNNAPFSLLVLGGKAYLVHGSARKKDLTNAYYQQHLKTPTSKNIHTVSKATFDRRTLCSDANRHPFLYGWECILVNKWPAVKKNKHSKTHKPAAYSSTTIRWCTVLVRGVECGGHRGVGVRGRINPEGALGLVLRDTFQAACTCTCTCNDLHGLFLHVLHGFRC